MAKSAVATRSPRSKSTPLAAKMTSKLTLHAVPAAPGAKLPGKLLAQPERSSPDIISATSALAASENTRTPGSSGSVSSVRAGFHTPPRASAA